MSVGRYDIIARCAACATCWRVGSPTPERYRSTVSVDSAASSPGRVCVRGVPAATQSRMMCVYVTGRRTPSHSVADSYRVVGDRLPPRKL